MRLGQSFSIPGLLVGTLFFSLSLTPSLIPRDPLMQGIVAGFSFAAGYGLGTFLSWLWAWLQLPTPGARSRTILGWICAAVCLLLVITFLWQATEWQNSVRELMGLPQVTGVNPFTVALVALVAFLLILAVARVFRHTIRFMAGRLEHRVPPRVSVLLGLVAAFALFWAVVNDVLVSAGLHAVDAVYRELDARLEPDMPAPSDPDAPGGANSLVRWRDMGHQGRRYLALGPTAAEIGEIAGEARQPLRVYVGLNAAASPRERARLALEEFKRVGGFDRSLVVLITPTGTGWVDPGAINAVEFLHRGDIASVATQYSYLPSPIALMTQDAYGRETAEALFHAIYGHWRGLPRETRPKLYLFGLSLGALNSDRSFDFYDIIDDPFHGALWTGPPFRSDTWRAVTANRDPGSPAWLPQFRGGAVVRFGNHHGGYQKGRVEWGDFRIAYLQHASDPIVFFTPDALFRRPAWMQPPRGPGVSPELKWYPVVTMFQLAADMHAGIAPMGFGHSYAPADYVRAWQALTEPQGWNERDLERLQQKLLEYAER